MANSGKGTFQPVNLYISSISSVKEIKVDTGYQTIIKTYNGEDSDVHISYEDQQKINRFAKFNAKVDDIKEALKVKQNDMKNLEEAVDELSLADSSERIPYLIGEIFMSHTVEEALASLEEAKTKKQYEIECLEQKSEELKSHMSDLKAHLYGKFGSHINLENDEE